MPPVLRLLSGVVLRRHGWSGRVVTDAQNYLSADARRHVPVLGLASLFAREHIFVLCGCPAQAPACLSLTTMPGCCCRASAYAKNVVCWSAFSLPSPEGARHVHV